MGLFLCYNYNIIVKNITYKHKHFMLWCWLYIQLCNVLGGHLEECPT